MKRDVDAEGDSSLRISKRSKTILEARLSSEHCRELLTCPLSGKLLTNAVVMPDGYSYDEETLKMYLETDLRSPITGKVYPPHAKPYANVTLSRFLQELEDAGTDSQQSETSE